MNAGCNWVYRKTFGLDLPVEAENGYDADRGSFGFILGFTWGCISSLLFVYEMVSVGLLAADLLQGSSKKNHILGAFTIAFMVLPPLIMGAMVLTILEGRALANCAHRTFLGVVGTVMKDGSSCLGTVYGETRSCLGTVDKDFRKAFGRVVKDLGSALRTVTSSPLDCVLGIILSPFYAILWITVALFLVLLIALGIVCEAILVVCGATAFILVLIAFLVFIGSLYIGFLSFVIVVIAAVSVVLDIILVLCWVASPWLAAVFNVMGGRYRSFRGVVNAGFHSLPQAIVQVVVLTSAHSSVPTLKIVRTLVIVVLSGSWATLTVYVQARDFCRKSGRPNTSLEFYVKEGLFVPIFEKEQLGMDDLDGSNFQDKGIEINAIENGH